jgi:hypothetical protein
VNLSGEEADWEGTWITADGGSVNVEVVDAEKGHLKAVRLESKGIDPVTSSVDV